MRPWNQYLENGLWRSGYVTFKKFQICAGVVSNPVVGGVLVEMCLKVCDKLLLLSLLRSNWGALLKPRRA